MFSYKIYLVSNNVLRITVKIVIVGTRYLQKLFSTELKILRSNKRLWKYNQTRSVYNIYHKY